MIGFFLQSCRAVGLRSLPDLQYLYVFGKVLKCCVKLCRTRCCSVFYTALKISFRFRYVGTCQSNSTAGVPATDSTEPDWHGQHP